MASLDRTDSLAARLGEFSRQEGERCLISRVLSATAIDHRLGDRVLGPYSIDDATVRGLHRLVEETEGELRVAKRRERRDRLAEFFRRLRGGDGVTYGRADVRRAAEHGAVETVLVAGTIVRAEREELEAAVGEQGAETDVVSPESERGARFAEAFGVGALVRFPVE